MLLGQVGRVRAHGTNNPRTDRCAVGQALPAPAGHPGGDPAQVRPATAAKFDKAAYRQRNHVERTVNRLKGWRRVAARYEKREVNYLAMVTIAAIVLLWL